MAKTGNVSEHESTPHGEKYVIHGSFITPNLKTVELRTVWSIDKGKENPRFVTAYPSKL